MAELDLNTYRVPSFERAIPGQSLTDDPENPAPYEKPFQVSTLMDGINTRDNSMEGDEDCEF